jgi:hypothetical protein
MYTGSCGTTELCCRFCAADSACRCTAKLRKSLWARACACCSACEVSRAGGSDESLMTHRRMSESKDTKNIGNTHWSVGFHDRTRAWGLGARGKGDAFMCHDYGTVEGATVLCIDLNELKFDH